MPVVVLVGFASIGKLTQHALSSTRAYVFVELREGMSSSVHFNIIEALLGLMSNTQLIQRVVLIKWRRSRLHIVAWKTQRPKHSAHFQHLMRRNALIKMRLHDDDDDYEEHDGGDEDNDD